MKKEELVAAVADNAEMSKADAKRAVNATIDVIVDQLTRGEGVAVTGFGSFEVGEQAARTGRNPSTGEEIQIPAKKTVKFKAGKPLKEAIQ